MDTIKAVITIRKDADSYAVQYNGMDSHHAAADQVDTLAAAAASGRWRSDRSTGINLGKDVYKLLNGSGGKLKTVIDTARNGGATLELSIETGTTLATLPFELAFAAASCCCRPTRWCICSAG